MGPRLTPYRPATSAVVSTEPRPGDHTIRTEPRDRFEHAQRKAGAETPATPTEVHRSPLLRSSAQRRPGPRPRRHIPSTALRVCRRTLNEGRGRDPGDTPSFRRSSCRPGPSLNEGRGRDPGDTLTYSLFRPSCLPDNPYWEDLMAALTQWRRPHYAVVIEALGNRIANESPNDIPNEHANDSAYSIPHHSHSHSHSHNHILNPKDDAVIRARARPSAQPAQPDDRIDGSKKLESLGIAEAAIQAFRSIPGRTDEREWGIVTKFGPNGTDERVWAGLSTEERPEVLSNALITLYSESPDRFHPPFFREILRRLAERTGSEQVTAQEEASTEAQRRENIQDWRDEIDRKEQLEDREAAEVNEKLDWLTKQPDDVKQTVEREVVKRLALLGTNVPEILRRGIVLSVMEEQGINPGLS